MRPDEITRLEAQLADPDRRAEAARALAQEHRAGGDAARLAVALEVLAVVSRDPGEEARLLAELGGVRLALRDGEQAALAFARALYLAPGEAEELLRALGAGVDDRPLALDVLEDLKTDAPPAAASAVEAALARLRGS